MIEAIVHMYMNSELWFWKLCTL